VVDEGNRAAGRIADVALDLVEHLRDLFVLQAFPRWQEVVEAVEHDEHLSCALDLGPQILEVVG
jgi:hypothetical protein